MAARLWGPTDSGVVHLALDTGATRSSINADRLLSIGYDPADATQSVRMITASGTTRIPEILVARLDALGQSRTPFSLLCHTLPPGASVDGVLGLDFMRGRRLTVDFRRGRVSLK